MSKIKQVLAFKKRMEELERKRDRHNALILAITIGLLVFISVYLNQKS